MGTRADFYIGEGEKAEWLGSVAWDGYEWAEKKGCSLMASVTKEQFREAVENIMTQREDASRPKDGWPWPWETSGTTDYVYWFKDGLSHYAIFDKEHEWPNMKDVQNIKFGSTKSGVIIVSI